ncbi:hypothetical protein L3X38_044511 [Prunus dulcis]|uniref:Disease resistance protein At4g27190-like leucine-rich repeats domain-containing protein n=1 Tax=Prunus dulcis TaxID=3755 RepID=A0AAD4UYS6_PRUDU|nr:hypothetical protein L3X38_044511 [Prunus dulcis]
MVEGRNSVETLVGILKSSSLLVDSNNEGCVRMHDVVRDAALSIASKSRDVLVVRYGTELNGWPNNYVSGQYISSTLITNETPELLLLSCPDECLLKPLTTILEGMENLKVLVMKNTFVLPSLPLLKNLQTLCLEHCNLNLDIGPVIGELRTLMTLSLRGSYIEKLPDECKNLIDLRVLDLTGCNSLKVISPGVISKFFLLEELYMWNNFGQWLVGDQTLIVLDQPCMDQVEAQLEQEQIDRLEEEFLGSREEHMRFIDWMIEEYHDEEAETYAAITDLLFLLHLTTLEIVLPPVNNLLRTYSLLFRGLVRFRISIGMMDKKWDVNPCGNYLRLHDLDAVFSLVGSEITGLLKDTNTLESLTLNDCNALEYLIDTTRSLENEGLESHTLEYLEEKYGSISRVPRRVFPVLNSLKINGARSLNEICYGQLRMGSLEELRQLVLLNLPVLTHLWMVPTEFECLPNPRRVEVRSCHGLESLFLLSVAGGLKKIEELDIRYCHHLEEIVALEEGRRHGEEANYKIKFPNLIRLNLRDLPSLVGISKNIYQMNFPQLITLKLQQLPELISLCPSSLAPESSSNAVIQHLFDPKLTENSVYFEGLEITNKHVTATLSCLEKIELTNLPSLEYVWKPHQNILAFQNLRMLQVMQYMTLRYVFPVFIVKAAGSGTAINYANLQFPTHIFNEKVDLPVLETLEILQMYNFKGIWNSQLPPHSFCELRDLNVSN